MNKKVSIIILRSKDHPLSEQCLGSLRRQTYDDIEHVIIETENVSTPCISLKKIESLKGAYVFWCDNGSTLSPDLIEKLIPLTDENVASASYVLFYDGFDYKNGQYCNDTILGKLFEKNTLLRILSGHEENISVKEINDLFLAGSGFYRSTEHAVLYTKGDLSGNKGNYTITAAKKSLKNRPSKKLSGNELSDYITKQFSNGNTGFKTLINSLQAWFMYKLKRKL